MDGPVVTAARFALDSNRVDIVLPFVPEYGEAEVRQAFDLAMRARRLGDAGAEAGDLHFFETVVRVHRAGEGAPFTGLKPAGLSEGPVIPVAEHAIETGSPHELLRVLTESLTSEVRERFHEVMELRRMRERSIPDARAYTEAMLGLIVWSHKLYVGMHEAAHKHQAGRAA